MCSQTSACTSQRPEPSRMLTEMGLSEEDAYASIRFAVSVANELSEIEEAVDIISRGYRKILKR